VIVAVVFDIDDTLYLERDYVRSGFAAAGEWARRRLDLPDLADRAWAAFEAGRRRTIFDEVLADAGVPATPDTIAGLVECYRSHAPAITLLPDARACLDAIASTPRLTTAVVTDGPRASQRAKAAALELDRWADPIVFTDEYGPDWVKPATHAFEMVQEKLGAAAVECVYVADNPAKDFAGPHRLGWATIRVRRPSGLHRDRDSGPDVTREVDDLTALLEWIEP
jgi:putative hydrolase of the HAD superfamily